MDAFQLASSMTLYTFVAIAVVMDFQAQRIGNRLIVLGIATGLMFQLLQNGMEGFVHGLVGMSIPVILLFLLYLMAIIGAGDIKLFSMIGVFVTYQQLMYTMAFAFVAGAMLSLVILLRNRTVLGDLRNGLCYLGDLVTGHFHPYEGRRKESNLMHFSIAICIGLVIAKGGML